MLAIILIDHRLALLALAALLVAAAVPLAWGWARLLPEEPPPFDSPATPPPVQSSPADTINPSNRDPFAIFLLLCVTLSYALKFPGMPVSAGLHWLSTLLPQDYFKWTLLTARALLVVLPGLAAAYSAVRPNPIRIALLAGGLLVVALRLASPFLLASLLS